MTILKKYFTLRIGRILKEQRRRKKKTYNENERKLEAALLTDIAQGIFVETSKNTN